MIGTHRIKVVIRRFMSEDSHNFVRIFVGSIEMNELNCISSTSCTSGTSGDEIELVRLVAVVVLVAVVEMPLHVC